MKRPRSRGTTVDASPGSPRGGASRRRRWLFRLFALALPLLPLAIGEAVCRWAGYGGIPAIFPRLNTVEGRTYFGTSQPGIQSFFFTNRSVAGSMREQVFTMPKDPSEVRVLLLGESAALGFPQPMTRSAGAFFEAMLSDLWPQRRVRLYNLGVTAIASFPVMYILDEALAFEPDLVIIYCGNNEFYGASGVASIHSVGQSTAMMRWFRRARSSALVQWIISWSTRTDRPPAEAGERTETLMERVIAEAQIGPEDARRSAARENLRRHLSWMTQRCRARGVAVILCTLPANERDLAPIGVDVSPALSADGLAAFEGLLNQGADLLEPNPAAALEALESAEKLYAKHALLQYRLARALSALGRHDEAAARYAAAKSLDTMPWRAPDELNEVIRQVARDERGVWLCDLLAAFRAASPEGSPGWALMDDHVHPSLRGQALIAETWLRTLTGIEGPLHVAPADIAALPDWRSYATRLGDNEYDRYGVAQTVLTLFRAPFFLSSNPEAAARFEKICQEGEAAMSPAAREAARRWQNPAVHAGGHYPITGLVGEALVRTGDLAAADRLLSIARDNVAPYSLWNLELTWKALCCRRELRAKALPEDIALMRTQIERGETMWRVTGQDHPRLHKYLGLVYWAAGAHDKAVAHLGRAVEYVKTMEDFDVVEALVASLRATGQEQTARRMLQLEVRDPALRDACRGLLAELDAPGN